MFLEEFSSFLAGLVLTTSALLVAGDFHFHIDEPIDCDARRFLQVLESFDSEATRKKGHILDLIITRTREIGWPLYCGQSFCLGSPCCTQSVGPC